jgi:hypothetical protein
VGLHSGKLCELMRVLLHDFVRDVVEEFHSANRAIGVVIDRDLGVGLKPSEWDVKCAVIGKI